MANPIRLSSAPSVTRSFRTSADGGPNPKTTRPKSRYPEEMARSLTMVNGQRPAPNVRGDMNESRNSSWLRREQRRDDAIVALEIRGWRICGVHYNGTHGVGLAGNVRHRLPRRAHKVRPILHGV